MAFGSSVIYSPCFVSLLSLLLRLCLRCWCIVRTGRTKLSFSLFPQIVSFLIGKRTLLDNLTLSAEYQRCNCRHCLPPFIGRAVNILAAYLVSCRDLMRTLLIYRITINYTMKETTLSISALVAFPSFPKILLDKSLEKEYNTLVPRRKYSSGTGRFSSGPAGRRNWVLRGRCL